MKRETFDLIESSSEILAGKPVIKGTRISVELILEKLAEGESTQDILDAHPKLTIEAIRAAIAYAAANLKSDFIYPIKKATAK